MDPVEIYKKLVTIKPFFEQVPIKGGANTIVHTHRRTQLIRGGDGIWREPHTHSRGGDPHVNGSRIRHIYFEPGFDSWDPREPENIVMANH